MIALIDCFELFTGTLFAFGNGCVVVAKEVVDGCAALLVGDGGTIQVLTFRGCFVPSAVLS